MVFSPGCFICCVDLFLIVCMGSIDDANAMVNQHVSVCLQALGDMLSQGRSGQTAEPQAEASEQFNSPDVFSRSAAVSRRASAAMPPVTLKALAASRRGSTAAAVPMGSEYTDEVKATLVLKSSMQIVCWSSDQHTYLKL